MCGMSHVKNLPWLGALHRWQHCRTDPIHSMGFLCMSQMRTSIHPPTWNPKMEVWKMIFLFKQVIFRFHASLRGCSCHRKITTSIIWMQGPIVQNVSIYQVMWHCLQSSYEGKRRQLLIATFTSLIHRCHHQHHVPTSVTAICQHSRHRNLFNA